jgi:hypothetical protein
VGRVEQPRAAGLLWKRPRACSDIRRVADVQHRPAGDEILVLVVWVIPARIVLPHFHLQPVVACHERVHVCQITRLTEHVPSKQDVVIPLAGRRARYLSSLILRAGLSCLGGGWVTLFTHRLRLRPGAGGAQENDASHNRNETHPMLDFHRQSPWLRGQK